MNSNLLLRTITSIILLSLVIWVFFLGDWAVYFLTISMTLLSCKELMKMVNNKIIFTLLTMIMVLIPYSALIHLYSLDHNIVLWLLTCIWATDIAAYFTGKTCGKKKICSMISPNKTWAGLVGGLIASSVSGFIIAYFLTLPYQFFFLGPIVTITAQIGDFFESGIKRIYHCDDSGSILPGHGGILDRMDGIIFTAPIFALLVDIWLY